MNEGDSHGVDENLYEVVPQHSISSPIFLDLPCPDRAPNTYSLNPASSFVWRLTCSLWFFLFTSYFASFSVTIYYPPPGFNHGGALLTPPILGHSAEYTAFQIKK
jgi:hypothetical protein